MAKKGLPMDKSMVKYLLLKKIEDGSFHVEDVDTLLKVVDFSKDSDAYSTQIKSQLHKIVPQIAIYFDCDESEICIENYPTPKDIFTSKCPYKVVLNDMIFTYVSNNKFENLQYIGGKAIFYDSKNLNLKKLKIIYNDANFKNSHFNTCENLEAIYGNANFSNSEIVNLKKLKIIDKNANFVNSKIKFVDNLEEINGTAYFDDTLALNLDNIKNIHKIKMYFTEADCWRDLTLNQLKSIMNTNIYKNHKVNQLKEQNDINLDKKIDEFYKKYSTKTL